MNGFTPRGYRPATTNKGDARDDFYRELQPNAGDLIDALTALPPDTTVEVGSSEWDGGATEPTGVWYYPDKQKAFIG